METHRHVDGTPVSEEAEAEIARHDEATRRVMEMQATQESQGDTSNLFYALAEIRSVMGAQEHHGRVPGLGFGARPTQVFGPRRNRSVNEAANPSQSYESRVRREMRAREDAEYAEREERLRREREEADRSWERLRREREEAERAAARATEAAARLERIHRDLYRRLPRSPRGSSDNAP